MSFDCNNILVKGVLVLASKETLKVKIGFVPAHREPLMRNGPSKRVDGAQPGRSIDLIIHHNSITRLDCTKATTDACKSLGKT
jgi:hypothetical protein